MPSNPPRRVEVAATPNESATSMASALCGSGAVISSPSQRKPWTPAPIRAPNASSQARRSGGSWQDRIAEPTARKTRHVTDCVTSAAAVAIAPSGMGPDCDPRWIGNLALTRS
jgi:hypothetical protein